MLQLCSSYHGFHFEPRPLHHFRSQPSRRQAPNNFFGSGFSWDHSDHSNHNSNHRGFGNFDSDRVLFDDKARDNNFNNFPRMPWSHERNFNRPEGSWNNNINPTTSPIRTSTVAIPGMGTTRSPCEDACQITPEYNPVCGTNGVTYTNDRWLKCAQNCGRRVAISYYGSCPRTF